MVHSNNISLTLYTLSIIFFVTLGSQISPKIAIVGGGIGGTSCAFFLKNIFKGNADITLYERDIIGGRLHLINFDGNYYEAGGTVIHPQNQYMMDFTKLLGLEMKKLSTGKFGIYDGRKFVLQESDWYIVSVFKMFWRYGISVFEIWRQVKSMLADFNSIYHLQRQEYSFTTVNGMIEYMSPIFKNMTQVTLLKHLSKKSYSEKLIDELVQSVMIVNYGQTNNISAFAGFVSLAGADSNLWSVSEGNKKVPEGLLKESGATIVDGDVTEIVLLKDGTYSLKYIAISNSSSLSSNYDIVIIANPFIKGEKNIRFTNFKKNFEQYERKFRKIVVTFVKGVLNPSAFNTKSIPDEIVACTPGLLFNSISQVFPVKESHRKTDDKVYKIFSSHSLNLKTLNDLFLSIKMKKEKEWLAYPHYEPPESLPPFMLYPNLYYINSVELSASAMEMSSVGAKNVALLAFNLWNNLIDKTDHFRRVYKDEL